MKKMGKRIMAVCIVIVMMLSLVACGGSKSEKGSAKDENTLTVWAWDSQFNLYAMEEAAKIYQQKNPDFKLETTEITWDDLQTKLGTIIGSGDFSQLPDICLMQDYAYQKYVTIYDGLFQDITDCGIDFSQFAEGKLTASVVDGKNYGVPFDNGADVYVRIKFTAGKPYEFEITGYTTEESDELSRFILTATMGNKARLRTLHLANGKNKKAGQLWPTYKESNFTEHNHTPLSEMIKDKNGGAWFIASPDEEDPAKAVYAEDTHTHWKYTGKKSTQYGYCPKPSNELEGVVNGRYTYWASKSPIPGGISYENFELTEPFRSGQSYVFGITPLSWKEVISGITTGLTSDGL